MFKTHVNTFGVGMDFHTCHPPHPIAIRNLSMLNFFINRKEKTNKKQEKAKQNKSAQMDDFHRIRKKQGSSTNCVGQELHVEYIG